MVGAGFIKKKFSNAGKFALAFSIFSAQLLPIHQAAHAAGEFSSVYKIPKSSKANEYIDMKVPFKANVGDPLLLHLQTLPNSNHDANQDIHQTYLTRCSLTSSDGFQVRFISQTTEPVEFEIEFYEGFIQRIFFIAKSTNLVINCKFPAYLSEGTLKAVSYTHLRAHET